MSLENAYHQASILNGEIADIRDMISRLDNDFEIEGYPASILLKDALKRRIEDLSVWQARIELWK
ncbi:MAG: hypothetical protein ACRYFE_08365 [Janthinobacterium lividum]